MKKNKFFNKNSGKYIVSVIEIQPEIKTSSISSIKSIDFEAVSESENNNIHNNNNNISGKAFKEYESNRKRIEYPTEDQEGCDFEAAIKATKYGKYNWFVLFIALWGYMSGMYTTTTMSLILPSAECELNLTNFDKGMLNSIVYFGMVFSSIFWGILSDSVGRRNVLIVGFALDAFFCILIGFAQNYSFLLISKLFSGLINSSLIVILASYVAECHANKYRASVTVGMGIFSSVGVIALPLLAWLIIPLPIRFVFFNGYIELPSWRLFLLLSAVPSFMAFVCLLFFDESPKFLMYRNRNEEAMKVFKRIYSVNTGKSAESFPVKSLKVEKVNDEYELNKKNFSFGQMMWAGWKQVTPIFRKPYLLITLLPCTIQFITLLSVNTIRLWSPELFTYAIEMEKLSSNSTIFSNICELVLTNLKDTNVADEYCQERIINDKVYSNVVISGVVTGCGYLISGYVVKILDRKWLMISVYFLSVGSCFALYWSTSSNHMLAAISIFTAVTSTAATALSSAVIDIFPTFLRTTALSLCLTFGRLGAMVGNLIFPILLDWKCTSPFIILAVILSVAAILTLLLPKTKGKRLE